MVSRETTRPLRKLVPAVVIGVSALLGTVGCGAGQVAQTAEMEPAVNGNTGQVGNLMLRDVMVAFPENGEAYRVGEDAPLLLTIVNVGGEGDELVGVTSPAGEVEITGNPAIPGRSALQVVLPGENPSASSSQSSSQSSSAAETTEPSEPGSTGSQTPSSGSGTTGTETTDTATSGTETESSAPPVTTTNEDDVPDVVGTISLVITGLTGDLPFGKQVPVTFEFAKAGKVTVSLPVAAPATPRAENRDHEVEGGSEGH
jgi:copper(I)-binding protein